MKVFLFLRSISIFQAHTSNQIILCTIMMKWLILQLLGNSTLDFTIKYEGNLQRLRTAILVGHHRNLEHFYRYPSFQIFSVSRSYKAYHLLPFSCHSQPANCKEFYFHNQRLEVILRVANPKGGTQLNISYYDYTLKLQIKRKTYSIFKITYVRLQILIQ